jgi:hypothetical protein
MEMRVMTMNLDSLVSQGELAWSPRQEARNVDVWHKYDFPTVGTYRLADGLVFFTVVGDTTDRLSVWAYVPVPHDQEAELAEAEFGSADEMQDFVEGWIGGHEATIALARDFKIWRWTPTFIKPDGLLPAAGDALDSMERALEANRRPAPDVLFQAKLAHAEVTTSDLVDA